MSEKPENLCPMSRIAAPPRDGAGASDAFHPPRPPGAKSRLSGLAKLLIGRSNIFTAMNERLYRGWLGRSNLIVHQAYLANQPDLVRRIMVERPMDFPKSPVMRRALEGLLGESVFVTNGEQWRMQRRMIDPAFAGGQMRRIFPVMRDCSDAMVERVADIADGSPHVIDAEMTHVTADVIFRTLFSIPIRRADAYRVFEAFGRYQQAAPFASLRAILGFTNLFGRWRKSASDKAGEEIRALLLAFVEQRQKEIANGTAPDDLATAIMTTRDPETDHMFDAREMLDQVAIFFLAGHETSATALTWSLYLIAMDQKTQDRMRAEANAVLGDRAPEFSDMKALAFTRDVFREAMRLYPPVPFVIRRSTKRETMRDLDIAAGSSLIVSQWYLQRHERLWEDPHAFRPDRWETENGKARARDAYIPFSIGPRVCPGAAFALQEGVLILSELVRRFRFTPVEGAEPEPVMQVTLRAGGGVNLRVEPVENAQAPMVARKSAA